MSKADSQKQVVKGYVIEDVPDTPQYGKYSADPSNNSWVYNNLSPLATKEVELVNGNIHFSCVCGKRVMMPVAYAGKKGKCPDCGKLIKIPNISI